MITHKNATVNEAGEFCNVYECQQCSRRSRYHHIIVYCEVTHAREDKLEQFRVGWL